MLGLPDVVSRDAFIAFVRALPSVVVRAKGLVRFADRPDAMFVWNRVDGRKVVTLDQSVPHASQQPIALFIGVGMPTDELRAGMSFSVSMKFPGDKYPAVDPQSVQWDSQGSFVWQVIDDKSHKVRVSVVQRNPDFILVKADLKDGDKIVTQGLQRVREGGAVRVSADVAANAEVATQ